MQTIQEKIMLTIISICVLLFYCKKGRINFEKLAALCKYKKTPVTITQKTAPKEIEHFYFTGPRINREVDCVFIRPEKEIKGAVLYIHAYPGDNNQFLDEGKILLKKGIASLHIDGLFPWKQKPIDVPTDIKTMQLQIIELRYALDILKEKAGPGCTQILCVGMDYGAMHGAVLTALEPGIKGFVFIAATDCYYKWNTIINSRLNLPEYKKAFAVFDPVMVLRQIQNIPVLMQFSKKDIYVKKEDALNLYKIVKSKKQIKWYDSNFHEEAHIPSQAERVQWIAEKIKE